MLLTKCITGFKAYVKAKASKQRFKKERKKKEEKRKEDGMKRSVVLGNGYIPKDSNINCSLVVAFYAQSTSKVIPWRSINGKVTEAMTL